MDDRAARAARRLGEWTGGVARNATAMETVSTEWWLAMTPEERLGCVFDMWDEQMLREDPAYQRSPRLDRAIGGVRALRS